MDRSDVYGTEGTFGVCLVFISSYCSFKGLITQAFSLVFHLFSLILREIS